MKNVDTAVYFPFSIFNLSTTSVVIDSLELTFPSDATVFGWRQSDRIQCHFLAGKTTEIIQSAH